MPNDASFIGTIPQNYDAGLGPLLFVDFAQEMARRVSADRPARVLETAAGTGIVTRALRNHLPATTELTATDLNPPMLEVAWKKFSAADKVTLQPADALALPFADGAFDAMVCQFGVMFYPDKDQGYREAHRVLAPGGCYHFSTWDAHRYNPFAGIVHEIVTRRFPDNPPQFYQVPFSCNRIDPIRDALYAANFTGINAEVLTAQRRVPDMAAFARGLIYGNPLIDQIRARNGDPEAIMAEVLERLKGAFGADGTSMPLQVLMFSARKPK